MAKLKKSTKFTKCMSAYIILKIKVTRGSNFTTPYTLKSQIAWYFSLATSNEVILDIHVGIIFAALANELLLKEIVVANRRTFFKK